MSAFKQLAILLVVATSIACEKNMNSPTAPLPPTQNPPAVGGIGGIGGYVFGQADGSCLVPARVEVLDGPRAGEAVQQTDCPFGDAYGYMFRDLPMGQKITIRASAPGYKSVDKQLYAVEQVPQTNFVLMKE